MSNRVIRLATNLLNYTAEAFIGTSVLMFVVSFFVFSRGEFFRFNKLTLSVFVLGLLLLYIAKRIKKRLDQH